MEKFPTLRESMISRLVETFSEIKSGRVFRGVLWIIGEFALSEKGTFNYILYFSYRGLFG